MALIALTLAVICVVAGSVTNTRTINSHTRAIRRLQASLTGVQSIGEVRCPTCLAPLSWLPWEAPAASSWWCAQCHRYIGLEPARSGENFKIE